MPFGSNHVVLQLCRLLVVSVANVVVEDLTSADSFDRAISKRNDVWVVVFNNGSLSEYRESQLLKAAKELKELVRFGRVDCNSIDPDAMHAGAPCGRVAKTKTEKVLGYTFNDNGERESSSETYTERFDQLSIVRWAQRIAPRLQVQLTSVRMEQLGEFIKRPRIVKALMFPKSEYSPLITGLALRFRKKVLIGEVKPTDGTMRKAFSVTSTGAMVVVDAKAKRHVYKGAFERPAIEKFLSTFVSDSVEADADVMKGLGKENFHKESYSDVEATNYPKGFDPFKTLGLPRSKAVPEKDKLKAAYKEAAKKWHPDKCTTGKRECEKRMSEAALANTVLSDGRRLQQWEAWRSDEARGLGRSDL